MSPNGNTDTASDVNTNTRSDVSYLLPEADCIQSVYLFSVLPLKTDLFNVRNFMPSWFAVNMGAFDWDVLVNSIQSHALYRNWLGIKSSVQLPLWTTVNITHTWDGFSCLEHSYFYVILHLIGNSLCTISQGESVFD
jgi:hypothetical protein